MDSNKETPKDYYKIKGLYIFARYFAAFLLMTYGFAKVNGSQFTVVEWVLDEPLKDVPGFWLVWYYMSYSKIYGTLVALVQIIGSGMLMFRRTTLLAAAILLPVMVNIVLINIFFQIQLGAFVVSLLITASLGVILIHHRHELLDLFWQRQNSVFPEASEKPSVISAKWSARVLIAIVPAVFTYWVANYNNILPTPIDGVWDVTEVAGEVETKEWPARIYFEKERAFMAAFRYENEVQRKHFEVNESDKSIDIWEQWLQKEEKYMTADYRLVNNDSLVLEGTLTDGEIPVRLVLEKVR